MENIKKIFGQKLRGDDWRKRYSKKINKNNKKNRKCLK